MAASVGAGKRLSKSVVEWTKFIKHVPKDQMANFQALKSKSDGYIARVAGLPEGLSSIDWAAYKTRAPALAATIDKFQQQYDAVAPPYPAAPDDLSAVDEQQKHEEAVMGKYVAECKTEAAESRKELDKWEKVPPLDHLLEEEWHFYFPGMIKDPKKDAFFYCGDEKTEEEFKLEEDYRNIKVHDH